MKKQERRSFHILIVDDESIVAMVLAECIENSANGYIVETAGSGTEALSKLGTTDYSLVITDYSMPGMNGIELAGAARQVSPGIQIILMTAYGSAGLRDTAGALQFDGFIDKPFSIGQIRDVVDRCLHWKDALSSAANRLELSS